MENPELLEVQGCAMRGADDVCDISNVILHVDIFPTGCIMH